MKSEPRRNDSEFLGTMPIGRLIARIAVPSSVAMLVTSTYNLTDAVFVGRGVGPSGLGALTLVHPFQMMVMGVGNLFALGTASIVSRALGAHDTQLVRRAVGSAFTASILTGCLVLLLGRILLDPLLYVIGATAELTAPTRQYLRLILLAEPLLVFNFLTNSLIRAEGRARTAMLTMIAGMVTNIVLDPLFIFAFGWGIEGAAWATIIGRAVTTVLILGYFLAGQTELKIRGEDLVPHFPTLVKISAIGFSGLVRHVSTGFVQTVRNNMLMTLGGGIYISALGAVFRSIVFFGMPAMGIAQALSPIAGYNYGAKKYDRVRRVLWLSMGACTAFMALGFLINMLFPGTLLRMFSADPDLLYNGVWMMRICAFNLLFFPIYFLAPAFYQSLGKPVQALILSLSRPLLGVIFISLAARFAGITGIVLGDPLSLVFGAAAAILFLQHDVRRLESTLS